MYMCIYIYIEALLHSCMVGEQYGACVFQTGSGGFIDIAWMCWAKSGGAGFELLGLVWGFRTPMWSLMKIPVIPN